MLLRLRLTLLFVVLLSFVITVPAFAGGWAVITLDELPSGAVTGEPLTVGFTVRQHGRTLMTGLYPKVTAILGEEKLEFPAQAEGGPGHYTATMTLPKDGEWNWAIEAFTMYQPMPAIQVTGAGTTVANSPAPALPAASLLNSFLVPVGLAVLGLGLLAAIFGFRRRSRLAMGLTVACLMVGIALLAVGTGQVPGAKARAKSALSNNPSLSQVELGRQLFLAKGCITCHRNTKASGSTEYMTIEMGAPDLSRFSASPEALHLRLKDPASVKSDTMMPNLELKKTEIEALIAFINSK
jgi:cytochrome c2